MPQFDFYSWYSVCLWTLVFFQLSYFLFLRFIFLPLLELSKIRQKLYSLILGTKKNPELFGLFVNNV